MFDSLLNEMMEFSSLGIRPGLERTSRLLSCMGSPQRRFPAVQVLGTNGKGSTAASLESIFIASGMRTALYTSPHLVSLQERLRLNGKPVHLDLWRDAYGRVRRAVETDPVLSGDRPTFFENLTALCFYIIAESRADIAVIEAGMGGRYDSTSLCEALGVVITPIGMDHMQYLGATLEAIASEKFAAVRGGVPAFYAADDESLIGLFSGQCNSVGAIPCLLDRLARPEDIRLSLEGTTFTYKPAPGSGLPEIRDLFTPLVGVHQAENAARAASVILKMREADGRFAAIGADEIRDGLRLARWPGRLEVFRASGRVVILDGAHNEHAFRALERSVASLTEGGALAGIGAVVFAAMRDKDLQSVFRRLVSLRSPVYCTQIRMERSMPASDLAALAESIGVDVKGAFPDPEDALSAACSGSDPSTAVLCCGSLFLVGRLREALGLTP
ncbi:MAG: bifunctional folylpolyglutamate synthase/dihydrofolate synthase [Synergistaceae bacterium]|nr:bifunctional folylpolyglutamate synthase/dihydrofolate synthase [Synergistaceae bacterium]